MGSERRRNHKDLILWQKSLTLAVEVHRLTATMPRHELFGLVSQMRRAAVSIASNVAEGAARRTTRDFIAFLHVARGSFAELETQLLLAHRIGYMTETDVIAAARLIDEVGRLLNAVISGLKRRQRTDSSLLPTP